MRIHLPGEHPLEFQCVHALGVALDVFRDGIRGFLVIFGFDQIE
jgi:hypothetical protein